MRVLVGLSGGVDSAVAALLLKEQGHAVEGLFMKNWEEDDSAGHCSAAWDLASARAVSEHLAIPLHTVNFAHDYWERVFRHFLTELARGRTPNPDVLCNREIKFRAFLDHALGLGAERIATGHYARIVPGAEGVELHKGRDPAKDQSYFLHALSQEALARSLFPVGGLTKAEVRARAARVGLPNHDQPDSTGICFIGERKFAAFVRRFLPDRPGEMRRPDGSPVGRHHGLMYYTIGQRQGLGIGGPGAPWYVAGKDSENNVLIVVQGEHHPALYGDTLTAGDPHWIAGRAPPLPLRCTARTRYRQPDQPCTVAAGEDGETAGHLRVHFDEPQRALTPGQSVVFYRGEVCLGGGVIETGGPGRPAGFAIMPSPQPTEPRP